MRVLFEPMAAQRARMRWLSKLEPWSEWIASGATKDAHTMVVDSLCHGHSFLVRKADGFGPFGEEVNQD